MIKENLKMFDYIERFKRLYKPVSFSVPFGSGRAVSVSVSGDSEEFVLEFKRRIKPSDVSEGKLVPVVLEEATRRGGKRLTTISISRESAEALCVVLRKALKDSHDRHFLQDYRGRMFVAIFSQLAHYTRSARM